MGFFDKFKKKTAEGQQTTEIYSNRIPFPAYHGSEPYIFISYAHLDATKVYSEITTFHTAGYHVWYDEGIAPGNEWTDEIANALEKCALFVVFITPHSAVSPNVQNEINFAIDEKKPFLAVHLEETTLRAGIKLQIGTKQAILKYLMNEDEYAYKYSTAFERLGLRAGKSALASAVTQTPQPENKPAPSTFTLSEQDRMNIDRIQNSEATMNDFEWIGSTVKAYHGIKKRFTIPGSPTKIASNVFRNRDYIEMVTLPQSVAELEAYVFVNCPSLELVIIENSDVHFAEVSPFVDCPKLTVRCHKDSATHENLKKTFEGTITFLDE
jgi:hypothetical protein